MKANPDKVHLLTSSNNELTIRKNDNVINGNKCRVLLGVNIDNKLRSSCPEVFRKSVYKIFAFLIKLLASGLQFY